MFRDRPEENRDRSGGVLKTGQEQFRDNQSRRETALVESRWRTGEKEIGEDLFFMR
jgi:hypothetical protein